MGRLSRELLGGGEPAPAPAPKPVAKAAPKPEPEVLEGEGMETSAAEALGSEDE
jgi:hypothetical protein